MPFTESYCEHPQHSEVHSRIRATKIMRYGWKVDFLEGERAKGGESAIAEDDGWQCDAMVMVKMIIGVVVMTVIEIMVGGSGRDLMIGGCGNGDDDWHWWWVRDGGW